MFGTDIGNFSKSGNLGSRITDKFVCMTSAHFSWSDDGNINPVVRGGFSFRRPYMEGKIKGAEAKDACLRKERRFVIIWANYTGLRKV